MERSHEWFQEFLNQLIDSIVCLDIEDKDESNQSSSQSETLTCQIIYTRDELLFLRNNSFGVTVSVVKRMTEICAPCRQSSTLTKQMIDDFNSLSIKDSKDVEWLKNYQSSASSPLFSNDDEQEYKQEILKRRKENQSKESQSISLKNLLSDDDDDDQEYEQEMLKIKEENKPKENKSFEDLFSDDDDDDDEKKEKKDDLYLKILKKLVQCKLMQRFDDSRSSSNHETTDCKTELFLSTILSMNISWLFQEHDQSIIKSIRRHYSVDSIGIDLNSTMPMNLPLRYQNMAHFCSIYTPLIILESCAQIRKTFAEKVIGLGRNKFNFNVSRFTGKPLKIDFIHALHVNTYEFQVSLSSELSLEEDLQKELSLNNWLVLVVSSSQSIVNYGLIISQKLSRPTEQSYSTSIIRYPFNYLGLTYFEATYKIKLYGDSIENASEIWPLCYFRPPIRMIETLANLEARSNLMKAILKPSVESCVTDIDYSKEVPISLDKYNEAQQKVIKSCHSMVCCRDTSKICFRMIQGPPGTGKTHTLVGVVKVLFGATQTCRIMICAPSNGAVDEIARRLLQERDFRGSKKPLLLVRIGIKEKIHREVQPYWLDNLYEQIIKKIKVPSHINVRDELRKRVNDAILRCSEVILCTLGSSQSESLVSTFGTTTANRIDCLIVDEAAQCCEPELLLPLLYPSISKIILIGDHLQLPATVISLKADQYHYGRSLFERFYLYFQQNQTRIPVTMLTEQYRMRSEIVRFPSKQFYENRLTTVRGSGKNAQIPFQPYFVFNLTDSKETSVKSGSKSNPHEADFIIKLLHVIFNKITPPVSIGVITFYKAQCRELLCGLKGSHLGKAEKECVTINTVDGYQGQERDIIILSCVRASDPSLTLVNSRFSKPPSVGFVQSSQRMNVALTRAKTAIFIILSGATFAEVSNWNQLISDAKECFRYFRVESTISLDVLSELTSV